MPYVVDPDAITEPADLKGATQGAEELRTLKKHVKYRTHLTPMDKAFGAVQDGVTNDGPAIQACWTAAKVLGKKVRMPRDNAGIYYVAGSTFTTGSCTIEGDGGVSYLKWDAAHASYGIIMDEPYARLIDMFLDKPTAAGAPAVGAIAIDMRRHDQIISGVRVQSSGGLARQGWTQGLIVEEWTQLIEKSQIYGDTYGINSNLANYVIIPGGSVAGGSNPGAGAGILINGGVGFEIGADIEGGTPYGIVVNDGGGAGTGQGSGKIQRCYIEGMSTAGIRVIGAVAPGKNAGSIDISGNIINGSAVANYGIDMDYTEGIEIGSNTFVGFTLFNIRIGANNVGYFLKPNKHIGATPRHSIDAAAIGFNFDKNNGIVVTGTGLGGGGLHPLQNNDYYNVSGGSDILKGGSITLFGEGHATHPMEGRLDASLDGVTIGSFVRWAIAAGVTKGAFFDGAPIAKPTGVAVTAAGLHAALVALNLIAP